MKDQRTESQRIFSTFVTSSVITISFVLIFMGVFAAKNNTVMIDEGITPAMIYARRENQQISVQIGEQLYKNEKEQKIPLTKIAQFAPTPINGIYIIYKSICETAKN